MKKSEAERKFAKLLKCWMYKSVAF